MNRNKGSLRGGGQIFCGDSTKDKYYIKGLYTLDIFARDIAIKRYCDIDIF